MPTKEDPYLSPTYSIRNRTQRAVWQLVYHILFRPSPRPFHCWRRLLLRLFGAKIGPKCAIHSSARIWAPWNLHCEDAVAIGHDVEIYNPTLVTIGSHAILSQGTYICGASHDPHLADFPTISKPIFIGSYSWLCAKSTVMPGINVGDGAVLALGSIATKSLDAWQIYAGAPARRVCERRRADRNSSEPEK